MLDVDVNVAEQRKALDVLISVVERTGHQADVVIFESVERRRPSGVDEVLTILGVLV
jgi:hypothetical protein